MNVAQYNYQPVSSLSVQVGKLDQNSVKEDEVKKTDTQEQQDKVLDKKESKNSDRLLDIYA